VRAAEDAWNSRDPAKVALAYTPDSRWQNRSEFFSGREEIEAFLTRKWAKELDYRLIKELWAFTGNRIAVRFVYEWHDDSGNWFRSYGNENWEFDDLGVMRRRIASINDLPIQTTCPSKRATVSFTGRLVDGRTAIRTSRTSGYEEWLSCRRLIGTRATWLSRRRSRLPRRALGPAEDTRAWKSPPAGEPSSTLTSPPSSPRRRASF